ncbi:MAG: transglycosylase SLT domain-containing protein [Micropruina sp.]|uniref:aggregation-promoting factor C-terminal-like domain-containing protein n=1 Tax=Micropruina sp. TaxID=2737536 RepID=UPI0039E4AC58
MPRLVRPVLGVVATLALTAGFPGVALADPPAPIETASPSAPPTDRDEQASRDIERPAALPELTRALNNRQAALGKVQLDIATRARALQATQFLKDRAAAEKKVRYADKVKKIGYDPKKTDPRDIAKQIMLEKYEWGADQFSCLNKIFTQESGWKWNATNPSSGAYGIPQSLPGTKMATEGDDWKTNPATQIKWGLKYIKQRYGTPCAAWGFKSGAGWY